MRDSSHIILNKKATIRDALSIINKGSKGIALITSSNQKLLGTITDGDIRRALLEGKHLDDIITDVYNSDPHTIRLNESKSNLLRIATKYKIYIIPVVDEENRIIGIEDINDYLESSPHENLVILMAGGLGKRLKPLTEDVPKPMLKVGDKLILETIIENFKQHGFTNFAISVNYKSHMIRDYFGNGDNYGISITYIEEKEKMGTAGSLSIMKNTPKKPFFVMNGDILSNINLEQFLDFHQLNEADATVAVTEISFEIPYGVIQMKNKNVMDIREKPSEAYFVNAGIYILNPVSLKYMEGAEYMDMPQMLKKMINDGKKVISFPIHEYWLDIGKMEDYKKAQSDYKSFTKDD